MGLFRKMLDLDAAARAMRELHSRWLTRSLQHGQKRPRIPTRRVSEGGWTSLMETPEGRAWADEFWESALSED